MTTLLSAAEKAREALEPFALFGEWLAEVKKDEISVVVQMANFKRARTAHALLSQCLDDGGANEWFIVEPNYHVYGPESADWSVASATETIVRDLTKREASLIVERHNAALSASPQSPAQVPTVEEVARVIDAPAFDPQVLATIEGDAGKRDFAWRRSQASDKAERIIALFHQEGEKRDSHLTEGTG